MCWIVRIVVRLGGTSRNTSPSGIVSKGLGDSDACIETESRYVVCKGVIRTDSGAYTWGIDSEECRDSWTRWHTKSGWKISIKKRWFWTLWHTGSRIRLGKVTLANRTNFDTSLGKRICIGTKIVYTVYHANMISILCVSLNQRHYWTIWNTFTCTIVTISIWWTLCDTIFSIGIGVAS